METAPRFDKVAAKQVSQLPLQVVAALDSADPAGLRSLLTTLACSLDVRSIDDRRVARPVAPARRVFDQQSVAELAVRRERAAAPLPPAASRPRFGPIAAHVLLPMTVATSALVLLMAWIR